MDSITPTGALTIRGRANTSVMQLADAACAEPSMQVIDALAYVGDFGMDIALTVVHQLVP